MIVARPFASAVAVTGAEDPSWIVQVGAKQRRVLEAKARDSAASKDLADFFRSVTPSLAQDRTELKQLKKELDKLKTQDVSEAELQSIKTRAKADLIRGLADNQGLALQLGFAQALYGDWRELFRQIDHIDKVTAADIRRVAAKTFVEENRSVAMLETKAADDQSAKQTKGDQQ